MASITSNFYLPLPLPSCFGLEAYVRRNLSDVRRKVIFTITAKLSTSCDYGALLKLNNKQRNTLLHKHYFQTKRFQAL